MSCRIDRRSIEQGLVVLCISGRLAEEDLDVVRNALNEGRVAALDLAEVELARRDAVASRSCRSWRHPAPRLSGLHPRVDGQRTRERRRLRVIVEFLIEEGAARVLDSRSKTQWRL